MCFLVVIFHVITGGRPSPVLAAKARSNIPKSRPSVVEGGSERPSHNEECLTHLRSLYEQLGTLLKSKNLTKSQNLNLGKKLNYLL